MPCLKANLSDEDLEKIRSTRLEEFRTTPHFGLGMWTPTANERRLQMAKIWRIGAGDKEKDLAPLMIEEGIMLLGPGYIGDISNKTDEDIKIDLAKDNYEGPRTLRMLISFRDAVIGEIIVLRLGSVCLAVGVISGVYEWKNEFEEVCSYWNPGKKYRAETPWKLQHTREVEWFILKDKEALCYFRRGIYGGQQRFCQVQERELHDYLDGLGYNGSNGGAILRRIGDRTKGVNKYGFPTV